MPPRCALAPYTSRLRGCRGCGDLWKEEGGGESPALAPPLPRLHGATPWDAGDPGRWGPRFHRTLLAWEGHYWDLLVAGQPTFPRSPRPGPLRGISGPTRYRFHPPTSQSPF